MLNFNDFVKMYEQLVKTYGEDNAYIHFMQICEDLYNRSYVDIEEVEEFDEWLLDDNDYEDDDEDF